MKKGLYLALIFVFLLSFSGFSYAYGPADESLMNKIEKNGKTVYEYNSPINPILKPEFDQIQSLFKRMAEVLNAILIWDDANKTIHLIKPEAQIIVANEVVSEGEKYIITNPFGNVPKGYSKTFWVYTEVMDLPEEEVELRLIVEAPNKGKLGAKEFEISPGPTKNLGKDGNYLTNLRISFVISNPNFQEAGDYKIKLQMRMVNSDKVKNAFYTIAEKSIKVMP